MRRVKTSKKYFNSGVSTKTPNSYCFLTQDRSGNRSDSAFWESDQIAGSWYRSDSDDAVLSETKQGYYRFELAARIFKYY